MRTYTDAIAEILDWIEALHGPAAQSVAGGPWLVPRVEAERLVWDRAEFAPDHEILIGGICEGEELTPAEFRAFIEQAREASDV